MTRFLSVAAVIVLLLVLVCFLAYLIPSMKEGMWAGTVPHKGSDGITHLPNPDEMNDALNPVHYLAKLENKGANMCWFVDPKKLYEKEDDESDEDECSKPRSCVPSFRMGPPGGLPDASRVTGHEPSSQTGISALTGGGGGQMWLDSIYSETIDAGKESSIVQSAGAKDAMDALNLASGGSSGTVSSSSRDSGMDQTFRDWARTSETASVVDDRSYYQRAMDFARGSRVYTAGKSIAQSDALPPHLADPSGCTGIPFSAYTMGHCIPAGGGTLVGVISSLRSGCNNIPTSVRIASVDEVRRTWKYRIPYSKTARVNNGTNLGYQNLSMLGSSFTALGSSSIWGENAVDATVNQSKCSLAAPDWHTHVWVKVPIKSGATTLPILDVNWQWDLDTVAILPSE